MVDRVASPAYRALSPAARRLLDLIDNEVARGNGVAAISFREFGNLCGMTRGTTGWALKQISLLGLVSIEPGECRRINTFRPSTRWQAIDAVAAKRLRTQAGLPKRMVEKQTRMIEGGLR